MCANVSSVLVSSACRVLASAESHHACFLIFNCDCLANAIFRIWNAFTDKKQYGDTALIWTATNGQHEHLRLLLEAGADKDAKDKVRGPMLIERKFE